MERNKGESSPKSGADRVRKHRARKKQLETQVVIGVAKLVLGQGAGEQKRAIATFMEKALSDENLDEEYARIIARAMDSINSTRR